MVLFLKDSWVDFRAQRYENQCLLHDTQSSGPARVTILMAPRALFQSCFPRVVPRCTFGDISSYGVCQHLGAFLVFWAIIVLSLAVSKRFYNFGGGADGMDGSPEG